uniref:Uncharacterized protein n=1 Tax=Ditylenchus dipsaci TaxID=166011 RepID=A0A915CUX6_9BILA
MVSYFLIIRLDRKTCTWYVLSMLTIGVGVMLRLLLNILYFGLPTIFESQNDFKERLETNEIFMFFVPAGVTE